MKKILIVFAVFIAGLLTSCNNQPSKPTSETPPAETATTVAVLPPPPTDKTGKPLVECEYTKAAPEGDLYRCSQEKCKTCIAFKSKKGAKEWKQDDSDPEFRKDTSSEDGFWYRCYCK